MRIKNIEELSRMIDVSAVRTDVLKEEIDEIAEACKRYNFICAFAMPCFTEYMIEKIKECKETMVGGVVGFPSGADLTKIKVKTANELINLGVHELDMVINVGALKTGEYETVFNDIRAVVETAGDIPVKSIIEVSCLTDDEICRASEIAVRAGVTFVKSGTGWGSRATTVNDIMLMKKSVGNEAFIKAAGGVRTLADVEDMVEVGCSRFGIGLKSIETIMQEFEERRVSEEKNEGVYNLGIGIAKELIG